MFTRSRFQLNSALLISIVFYLFAILLRVTTDEAMGIVWLFVVIGVVTSIISAAQVEEEHQKGK